MTPAVRNFRLLFFGALALFNVSTLSITGYTLWRLQGDALQNGLNKAALYTRNTEDFLTQSLRVTELAAAQALPADNIALDMPAMARSFTTTLQHAPFLRSISLLDAQGRIITSSNPANVGVIVATQNYLPASDGRQNLLRIGTPWTGRDFANGQPISANLPASGDVNTFVPITYTLVQETRAVTVVVALNPDYFLNHISQMLYANEGSVEVLRFDGTHLMATNPETQVGALRSDVVRALGLPETESGKFELVRDDHQKALTAFRASRLYPFVLVTYLDRGYALQVWRRDAGTLLGVAVSVLLLTSLFSVMYYRRQIVHTAQRLEAASARRISATVFDVSAEAITITDIHGLILSVNPAYTRMSGYSAAEVTGRNPRLLNSNMQNKAFYVQLWGDLLAKGSWQGEMVNRHKDGHLFDIQVSITTSRDSLGQAQHFIGVSTDITARKRAQIEAQRSTQLLIEATREAQAANLAKSRFLATMSHEIRTPMNGILGMAQLLLMPDTKEADRADYANTILTSGQSLLALLNDILDLSKIESGKLQLDSTEFTPLALMQDTQALFAGSAKSKNLTLESQWHGAKGQCYWTDTHRISQMLANLVGNAIKFTFKGHICVEGTEIERSGDRAVLEFSVLDTGLGIAADKLKLLFLPFSQTDNSTTRQFGGSGLGLSIVSSLAKMLGGYVGVDSTPDQGSRFWFRIRVELCTGPDVAPQTLLTTTTFPETSRFSGRVLVAEDNQVNALVIQALLSKLGLDVTVVDNGQQALDAITQGSAPDMVLMDLQMPEMDGLTATRQIRQWEMGRAQPRVPIIALTADAFEEDRQNCLAAGMDDFLSKPIALDALVKALRPWLDENSELAPVPPTPMVRSFDKDRFKILVEEITPLLTFNQFDALERFKDIVQLAVNTNLASEIAKIDTSLKSFQFDLVLTQLQQLAATSAEKTPP